MSAEALLSTTEWSKETALPAGVISWEEGESLYGSARGQLVASAKSSKEKKRYHGNTSAYLARQFIDSTWMGQTDIGSFVITAYTPAQQRFHMSKHSEEVAWIKPREVEMITGAEILNTFERALKAVRSILDESEACPETRSFPRRRSKEGVSFEFTRALGNFVSGGESSVQITRRVPGPDEPSVVEVAFRPTEAQIISRAANLFSQDPEPQDVTLMGEVTLLSREISGHDQLIRLNVESGADIRKARVRLSPEQYELAMDAHRREASLRVSGLLEKEGNLYWLDNPRDVTVVENEFSAFRRRPPVSAPTLFDLPEGQGDELRRIATPLCLVLPIGAGSCPALARRRRALEKTVEKVVTTWTVGRETRAGGAKALCVRDLTEPILAHHAAVSAGRRLTAQLNARPLGGRVG